MSKAKPVLVCFVVFASVLLAAQLAGAGEIHPDLARALEAAKPGDLVGALVMMSEQADIVSLDYYLNEICATRQLRHEAVVNTLMEFAEQSQKGILEEIYAKTSKGEVDRVYPLWIINAVSLYASASVVEKLAARPDVGVVYPLYPIELIEPVYVGPKKEPKADVEPGIEVTGAPDLWAMGIDGTGALVCDMDTGADGNHVAFGSRWRGHDAGVPASAAWFDPVTSTTFPFDSASHGTHTMGTMIGKDGDHVIGMAPGAKWIAAGVIDRVSIDQTIQDALRTMQWTIDPDGNPATVDDVPDVVNNSWGIPGTNCDSTFWQAIDNAEAAGTVYVWAAGNEGPFARTLRSPADRIQTDVNAFSVGALKQGGNKIAGFSSRGPSDCDGSTIKPEVTAVGENVTSSIPGNNYGEMSGTSMATPHVSGAVALLRSAHPDATVDEIKHALLNSCVDLGNAGEDNTYGMGRIDLVGALGELGFGTHGGVRGTVTVKETGLPIQDVQITINETQQQMNTGQDGKYRFLVQTPGTYLVTAYHPDYGTFPKQVDIAAGPWTQLDFVLSNIPVADFTADKTDICVGDTVQFTSLSQGLIAFYLWDFGDGTTSNETNVSHVYSIPGNFSVSIYVAGPTGQDQKSVADYIHSFEMPVADFSASTTKAKVGEKITFTDSSIGPANSWLWDFGDGTTSTEQNPVKSYKKTGTYSVTLNATNACGSDTKSEKITITEGGEGGGGGGGCGCWF